MACTDAAKGIVRTIPASSGKMASGVRAVIARVLIGAVVSAVAATNLVGCSVHTGSMVAVAPQWWESHLTVDRDLKVRGLRRIRLIRSRTESGFLRVAGEYVNQSDAKLSAIFRFTWLDASGMPVGSTLEGWQAVHALPRARATFAGIAPRDDVRDFRVELMAAHRLKGRPMHTKPDS